MFALITIIGSSSIFAQPQTAVGRQVKFVFETRQGDVRSRFVAATSDENLIREARRQRELEYDARRLHVNGVIAQGNGGHNQPWSWHFVPDRWRLAEVSALYCSTAPEAVEENLDYWLRLGRFCPISAKVVDELPHPIPAQSVSFVFEQPGVHDGFKDRFIAVTSNENVIAEARQELRLPLDQRRKHINGLIARGSGANQHNQHWSWHFVPNEWRLGDISAEFCDGSAYLGVEKELEFWLRLGRFCPWSARVVAELSTVAADIKPRKIKEAK